MHKHHSALGLATALRPVQPVTLLRPHAAARAARFFVEKFQGRSMYAVKANPAAPVLERLVGLSSCFDAASWEEIQACFAAGAKPEAISYGNTIKKVSAIRNAHKAGVTLFAFDSAEELEKLGPE